MNYQSDLVKGLIFEFDDNVLTVTSEYGEILAENIKNIYGTRGNDTMIGDENYQEFIGEGGNDILQVVLVRIISNSILDLY